MTQIFKYKFIVIIFTIFLYSCANRNTSHLRPEAEKSSDSYTKDQLQLFAIKSSGRNIKDQLSKYYTIPVFYGTDRKPTGKITPNEYYGESRNENENENWLEEGIVKVTLPVNHAVGSIESPKWWRLWNRTDTSKYMLLVDIQKMGSNSFYSQLKATIDSSTEKDAFIFIHGYNNTFSDAAKRTAQLAFDLGMKGAPIMYSWPSKGKVSEYISDENDIEWTAPHLKIFLTQIAEKTQAKRINVIAHSMGNRALTKVLKEFNIEHKDIHFNQIILAAPDIDADIFKNDIAPFIKSTATRITMYSSSEDRALKLSKKIHKYYRAGDTDSQIITVTGIETIDASKLKVDDFLDHSYFSEARPVLTDMFLLFNYDTSPDKRNLVSIHLNNSVKYWTFKK